MSNSLALSAQRRLDRDATHMSYLYAIKQAANLEGAAIAHAAQEQVLSELLWTEKHLQDRVKRGRLTPELEERVNHELAFFMEEIGLITKQAYYAMLYAIDTATKNPPMGRLEAAINTCYLLMDKN